MAYPSLTVLYWYIAREASPTIAQRFIVARCESLDQMQRQGTQRDDLRPGLRTLSFLRRVVIAYAVEAASDAILGIYYGGPDFEALLRNE